MTNALQVYRYQNQIPYSASISCTVVTVSHTFSDKVRINLYQAWPHVVREMRP